MQAGDSCTHRLLAATTSDKAVKPKSTLSMPSCRWVTGMRDVASPDLCFAFVPFDFRQGHLLLINYVQPDFISAQKPRSERRVVAGIHGFTHPGQTRSAQCSLQFVQMLVVIGV